MAMQTVYRSTKTYGHNLGLSCCFRQWRAESHCRFLHGYALQVGFVFEADELDVRNWVVDFGSLKTLKGWLEDLLDHKTLVASDDPYIAVFKQMHSKGIIEMREVPATGCEATAALIFGATEVWLKDAGYTPRVRLVSVEVREHGANSAIVMSKAGLTEKEVRAIIESNGPIHFGDQS
jgi:6-pyruvoyltetrahydropterin/6-carboxytetrahydropterin synthase